MVATEKTIEVVPGSELDRLLDEAEGTTLVLVRNGRRFRLAPEDAEEDIWANYDPSAVRAGMRAAAGSWADVDVEQMIADIYRWRKEGSRPPDRP